MVYVFYPVAIKVLAVKYILEGLSYNEVCTCLRCSISKDSLITQQFIMGLRSATSVLTMVSGFKNCVCSVKISIKLIEIFPVYRCQTGVPSSILSRTEPN
ncbi:hypothetical protein CROQUDRAFT_561929 [Cronartium quercuum f. sp. fusiforme G11]|uniref:Uncharacterized protein n=1 Tax=Cronartium quercuum f. sp. fusiforme G11 TaxID=708437 RepID=A0A9P6TBF4_9BASI|nr:hypothetical protein CROQUDRAFT_561929 [Cronartium quercuum f. sp. fusiforme G11]